MVDGGVDREGRARDPSVYTAFLSV